MDGDLVLRRARAWLHRFRCLPRVPCTLVKLTRAYLNGAGVGGGVTGAGSGIGGGGAGDGAWSARVEDVRAESGQWDSSLAPTIYCTGHILNTPCPYTTHTQPI